MPAQVLQFPQAVDRLSPSFPEEARVMVDFATILHWWCEAVVRSTDPASRPTLVCTTTPVLMRQGDATRLARVARRLINRAYEAFIDGRGGRIAVTLRALGEDLELTVEHSRPETGTTPPPAPASEWRSRVADLGGVIERLTVIGGSRTVVIAPRGACHARRSAERGEGARQRRG